MALLLQIAKVLRLPEGYLQWRHGYYSVEGEELQRPRWRLETPIGAQGFAPDSKVARRGDIVVHTLGGLDAGEDTDEEAQRRGLEHLLGGRKRPKVGQPAKGEGARSVRVPVYLTPAEAQRLDGLRGKVARSEFLATPLRRNT